ncbi:hypothetical protein H7J71_29620 [Mycolicibacterium peregrinum]|uniref:hypothetical protein n=1 Tax=Mycolicibacterium peregrinum TaxID=43304 RepID=UPI00105583E2|nr:hypothetical protein [Mycolicibacterium peregrinum]MCV7206169.1 hypothetical protein [Mycolicibacterium peregrinum]
MQFGVDKDGESSSPRAWFRRGHKPKGLGSSGITLLALSGAITVVVATYIGFVTVVHDPDTTDAELANFTPALQRDRVQAAIDALNDAAIERGFTRLEYVPGSTVQSDVYLGQERNIRAAMPPDGCRYDLNHVEDAGGQGTKLVPGLSTPCRSIS